jgi:hypothetical protein
MESPDGKLRKSIEMDIIFTSDDEDIRIDEYHAFMNKNVDREKVTKVLDNALPFVVIKTTGNIKLRVTPHLMDKLGNDNFGIIRYQPESIEMRDKYKPNSDTTSIVVDSNENCDDETENEYYYTKLLIDFQQEPLNKPSGRKQGFFVEVHPETIKKIMKIYDASRSYSKSMQEKVAYFQKAQSRLADSKKQGIDPWIVSKFNEIEVVSPPKKIDNSLQPYERKPDIDKLLQKEENMLKLIEKNKLDSRLLLLDIRQLEQVIFIVYLIIKEIHLMRIHKEQVRCVDTLVTDSIGQSTLRD